MNRALRPAQTANPNQDLQQWNRRALRRLRREWLAAALAAIAALAAAYVSLSKSSFAPHATRWLVSSGIIMALMLGLLWRFLPRNHRPEEQRLFPSLGIGTWLTLLAGLLVAYLAGFLGGPWPSGWLAWAPAILYLSSRIVDLFDGFAARLTRHVTDTGAALDIEYDGLGLLIAVLLGVRYGQLPVWYLPLAVSRPLFVAGTWWRNRQGKPVHDLPPSDNRRITAGCQTGFVAIVLWPIISPPATTVAAIVFAIPLIASFARDWLVVSGAVDPESFGYRRTRALVKKTVEQWLPLAARAIGTAAGVIILLRAAPNFTTWELYLHAFGMSSLRSMVYLLVALFVLSLVLFASGTVGRLTALLIIALAVLDIQAAGFLWYTNGMLLVCAIIVFHFGSGCCSIWQPEEPLLRQRLGQEDST